MQNSGFQQPILCRASCQIIAESWGENLSYSQDVCVSAIMENSALFHLN